MDEDSSYEADSRDKKKIDALRFQGRKTTTNDLTAVYGEVNEKFQPKDLIEKHNKSGVFKVGGLYEVEEDGFNRKPQHIFEIPSGMEGKRASPQFDIGGETGYKSGLFAPRFWYDIYSYLNTTPLED